MVDPSLTFVPLSTDFGSIDVGLSCAYASYHVKNKTGAQSARNVSIYLLKSVAGVSEFIVESWAKYSTATKACRVGGSVVTWSHATTPSIVGGGSVWVKHKIVVPTGASSSGKQPFFGKHKYQFT